MLPEYYTHPKRFSWFMLKTNHGEKRTFAKTAMNARKKLEKHGLKVFTVKFERKIK